MVFLINNLVMMSINTLVLSIRVLCKKLLLKQQLTGDSICIWLWQK